MRTRSHGCACGCLALLLLLVLALLVMTGVALAVPLKTPLLGNLRYRCALGFEQTNASITLRGPLAGRGCRQLLDQASVFPVPILTTSDVPDAPVVCTFTERRVKVTVRGDRLLQLLGDNLCTVIRNLVADARHRIDAREARLEAAPRLRPAAFTVRLFVRMEFP